MHRILKPGGLFLHSLDLRRLQYPFAINFNQLVKKQGFLWLEPPAELDFTGDGLLYEPFPIVYEYYYKGDEIEGKIKAVSTHTCTVLVGAQK